MRSEAICEVQDAALAKSEQRPKQKQTGRSSEKQALRQRTEQLVVVEIRLGFV
jgi:hypothetical protein